MKCRKILLADRNNRNRELDEYEDFLKKTFAESENRWKGEVFYRTESGGRGSRGIYELTHKYPPCFQQLIEKRRCYLLLELPFQTDTVSLNHMLVKSFPADMPVKFRYPEGWGKQYFTTGSQEENDWKEKHILDLLYKYWPRVARKFAFDGEEVKIKEVAEAKVEDFVSDKLKTDLFYAIDQLPISDASKPVYKSRMSSLLKYLLWIDSENGDLPEAGEVNWSMKSELDVETLANYFDYLERRCLNKQSDDAYKDLVAIRLLFYAPATFEKLAQVCLKHIDKSKLAIQFEDVHFVVPSTFIALASAIFSKEEPLLRMDVKQLNKFIQQTSEANEMKKITPTALRQALRLICHQERFCIENLPRR